MVILLFTFLSICFAQEKGEQYFIFKKMPPQKHGIIVKYTNAAKISVGTILQATTRDGKKCNLKVLKTKQNLALVSTDYCPFEDKLQVQQQLIRIEKKEIEATHIGTRPYIFKKMEADQLISIKIPKLSRIKPGTALVATQFDQQSCIIKILRVYETYAVGETSECPFRKQLRINQPLTPLVLTNPKKKDIGRFLIPKPKPKRYEPGFPKKWYTYWGIGYGSNSIEGPDAIVTMEGKNHSEYTFDLLGFYFPFKKTNLLMGGVLNLLLDSFEYVETGVTTHQISYIHLLPSFSAMYFLGREAGSEWFLRGDLGIAKYFLSTDVVNSSSSFGVGVLLGGGYAWKLNFRDYEFNLLANVYYTHREVAAKNNAFGIDSFTLSVGILY